MPQSNATSHKSSVQSKGVTFDDDNDDNDDILVGMGLDDGSALSNRHNSVKTGKPRKDESSRLDELLGVSKPKSKLDTGVISEGLSRKTKSDPDDFQFEGYVPSAVNNSSTHSRRSLALPMGRYHGSSEVDPSLKARSNSVPSPAKKSVHFAQNLENSERPSSSSSEPVPKRPSLKTELSDKQSPRQPPPSAGQASVSMSNKPSLTVRMEEDDQEVMDNSTEDKGEENGGVKGQRFNPKDAFFSSSGGINFKDG